MPLLGHPAISRSLDPLALSDFLVYRHFGRERSIWKAIRQLPPGHTLFYQAGKGIRIKQYWSITPGGKRLSAQEAKEKIASLLEYSVRSHLLSDVPVGLLLSGGLDSSTLALFLNRFGRQTKSFNMGFDDLSRSEHEPAQQIAAIFGTSHFGATFQKDAIPDLKELLATYGEPPGGRSFLPTYRLAQFTSQQMKVVLSGDGGDEIFAGYRWHQHLLGKTGRNLFKKLALQWKGAPAFVMSHYQKAMNWTGWKYEDLETLLPSEMWKSLKGRDDYELLRPYAQKGLSPLKMLQLMDIHLFLPEVCLKKIDRAGMAHGLEVRVPFLDHQLVSFLMSLEEGVYFEPRKNKKLLYELLKGDLPRDILQRPKKGFGLPASYFAPLLLSKESWKDKRVVKDGLFNKPHILRLIDRKEYKKLWAIHIFANWYEQWLG